MAWTGATISQIEPAPTLRLAMALPSLATRSQIPPLESGITNTLSITRTWIARFSHFAVPLGPGVTISNIGFHAPPQEPAWANDGTVGNTGFSSTAWTPTQTSSSL